MRTFANSGSRLHASAALLMGFAACGSWGELKPTPIPVRVDPDLNRADTWSVTEGSPDSYSFETATPLVKIAQNQKQGVEISITSVAPPEERERVEICLVDSGHELRADAQVVWYGNSSVPTWIEDCQGSITTDAGHLPTLEEVRVIEWQLSGTRGGTPVYLHGKVRWTARDMNR